MEPGCYRLILDMKKLLLLCLLSFLLILQASAQQVLLIGRVTDTKHQPVGFAAIYVANTGIGTTANEQGFYQLKLKPGRYPVTYRYFGCHEKTDTIILSDQPKNHNVQLVETSFLPRIAADQLDKTGRVMISKAIARGRDIAQHIQSYSNTAYVKGVQKLVGAPKGYINTSVANALSIDSSGKGMLFQTESISELSALKQHQLKEVTISSTTAGQNISINFSKASDLSQDLYQDILIIPGISSHGFISPLGSQGLSNYDYQFIGASKEGGKIIDKIGIVPKRTHGPLFRGNIYLVDGSWDLYGAELTLTDQANQIEWVDSLQLRMQYMPVVDGLWEPMAINYSFSGSILAFKYEGYYLGIFDHYQLNPHFTDHFFNGERLHIANNAQNHDLAYWKTIRPLPLTPQEDRDYSNKSELASLKKAMAQFGQHEESANPFKPFPYLLSGYKAAYKKGKDTLYVFPFVQTLFYNTIEGAGINLQASFTHLTDSIHAFTLTPNLRYGLANRLFSANLRGEYNYDPDNLGKFTGGFGSDLPDLSNVGTRSLFFNTLSTLLSEQNFVKLYRSKFIEGGFQREISNGLLLKVDLSHARRTQLYNNSFYSIDTYAGRRLTSNNPLASDTASAADHSFLFPQHTALTFAASLTYTINQEYITRPGGRDYLPSAYPQIKLSYRKGINGLLGSNADYDFSSLAFYQEHLSNGLLGFSSFKIEAGDFFNNHKVYFMDYNHFQGNEGTTFDPTPGNFHFLPFYTYSTDGPYFEAHYEHNFSGYFFSRLPLLRSLKLDEIIGLNYLSENNNHNYSEFFFGVQRSYFRIDYGVAYEGSHKYLQGFRVFYGLK